MLEINFEQVKSMIIADGALSICELVLRVVFRGVAPSVVVLICNLLNFIAIFLLD